MVTVNTWLFGIGSLLIGYNAYLGLPADAETSNIFASFTVKDASILSSLSIMIAGVFYSLVILRPEMKRNFRETRLLELQEQAAHGNEYTDRVTGLNNRVYFEKTLDCYTEKSRINDETIGIFGFRVRSDPDHYLHAMRLIGGLIKTTARDGDIVAKIDANTIAILMPDMQTEDFLAISSRFQSAIVDNRSREYYCSCTIGFTSTSRDNQTRDALLDSLENSFKINKRLAESKSAA
jgi:GGDEF domain-containing protein